MPTQEEKMAALERARRLDPREPAPPRLIDTIPTTGKKRGRPKGDTDRKAYQRELMRKRRLKGKENRDG
jgi:hypothetical protein